MDFKQAIALLLTAALAAVNIYFILSGKVIPPNGSTQIEYKDYVGLLLTVVTVVLGALAIGLALLALWGWQQIVNNAKTHAGETASSVAKDAINNHLKSTEFALLIKSTLVTIQETNAKQGLSSKGVEREEGKGDVDSEFPRLSDP